MDIFISPSSIGYIFAALVSWISSWNLYRSYLSSKLEATRVFALAVLYIGTAMFFYALPTFFFAGVPEILGWFNVPANFLLGIGLAYLFRIAFLFNFQEKYAKFPFYLFVLYTIFIIVPINIFYLPLPTFDKYNLEIWNYHNYLSYSISAMIVICTWSFSGSVWRYFFKRGTRTTITFPLAASFTLGALGGIIIINADTTTAVIIGYLTLVLGGFVSFAFSFIR